MARLPALLVASYFSVFLVFFPCSIGVDPYILCFDGSKWILDILYIGFSAMGDEPIKIPNDRTCPTAPWPNGVLPGYIIAAVSGIQKGSGWLPQDGEPQNGVWEVPFLNCTRFLLTDGTYTTALQWFPTAFFFTIRTVGYASQFSGVSSFVDPAYISSTLVSPTLAFYGGVATLYLAFDGAQVPYSWTPADLIPVPFLSPYLAEELPATQYSRFVRYVNNFNGTNIKMIGDF